MPSVRVRAMVLSLALALIAGVAHGEAGVSPARPLAQPGPESMARLEERRVLLLVEPQSANSDRAGNAEALVLFEQPYALVLRLLASTPRQIEYRPELQRLHVVEATERGDVAEYQVRFMLTTLRYRTRNAWDMGAGRVWWTLDPEYPNDLATLDGLWELRALDERRTLGRFTTRIDLGPALPAFLQDYATRRRLPEAMEHVRRWVDSGGRWRP